MLMVLAYAHVLIGLALVLFVLLQDPKGGAMGVFSGGSSSNTFFGSSGASNFLTSTTKWLAILFAISCLVLTYLTASKGTSVMDTLPATAPVESAAPKADAVPAAAGPAAELPAAPPATPEKAK
jgi:preprotein translocase subunit SecG